MPSSKQCTKELKGKNGKSCTVTSETRARQQEPKSQESKSESPLGDEGGQGKGEIHYDPARKEDILGRTKTRLGLWEEHLKDPVNALESIKVLGERLLRLAIGSKLLV